MTDANDDYYKVESTDIDAWDEWQTTPDGMDVHDALSRLGFTTTDPTGDHTVAVYTRETDTQAVVWFDALGTWQARVTPDRESADKLASWFRYWMPRPGASVNLYNLVRVIVNEPLIDIQPGSVNATAGEPTWETVSVTALPPGYTASINDGESVYAVPLVGIAVRHSSTGEELTEFLTLSDFVLCPLSDYDDGRTQIEVNVPGYTRPDDDSDAPAEMIDSPFRRR